MANPQMNKANSVRISKGGYTVEITEGGGSVAIIGGGSSGDLVDTIYQVANLVQPRLAPEDWLAHVSDDPKMKQYPKFRFLIQRLNEGNLDALEKAFEFTFDTDKWLSDCSSLRFKTQEQLHEIRDRVKKEFDAIEI